MFSRKKQIRLVFSLTGLAIISIIAVLYYYWQNQTQFAETSNHAFTRSSTTFTRNKESQTSSVPDTYANQPAFDLTTAFH